MPVIQKNTFPKHLVQASGRGILTSTKVTHDRKDVHINLADGEYTVIVHDRTPLDRDFKSYGWTQTLLDYCIREIRKKGGTGDTDFDPGADNRQHVSLAAAVIAAMSTRNRNDCNLKHHIETTPDTLRCYIEYQRPGRERTWIYEYVLTTDETGEVQVQFNWHDWRDLTSLYQDKPTEPTKDPLAVMMTQALVNAILIQGPKGR